MKVVSFLLFLSCSACATEQKVQLLLPADESKGYSINELPTNPGGMWWVIDRVDKGFYLSEGQVVVNKYQGCGDWDKSTEAWSGRTVEVPGASNPIALIRGNVSLKRGSLLAVDAKSSEESSSLRFEFTWKDKPASVRYLFEMPRFEQRPQIPGKYQVIIKVRDKENLLYSFDDWDGEGYFEVRWIGDINRDGAPDVLLDTSRKYSSRTTRLFLSKDSELSLDYFELASFYTSSC